MAGSPNAHFATKAVLIAFVSLLLTIPATAATTEAPYIVRGATVRGTGRHYALATTQDHFAIDTMGFNERNNRVENLVREASLDAYLANPDIIAEVAALDGGPLTIGFAAETEKLREHAMEKLSRKRLDMIAANRVGQEGSGFEVEENEILLLSARGERPLGRGNKRQLARRLIEEVAEVVRIWSDKSVGRLAPIRYESHGVILEC